MIKHIWLAVQLLAALGVISALAYFWSPSGERMTESEARAAAADYSARILRDDYGVPHIYGARDADVAFGLAYAHAEDDWDTLEETFLFTRGTLGMVKGRSGAVTDYLVDLLKVHRVTAERYERDHSRQMRAIMEAYAAGINLWMADHPERVSRFMSRVQGQDIAAGSYVRQPFFFGLQGDLDALFAEAQQKPVSPRIADFYLRGRPENLVGSNAFAVAPARSEDGHTRLFVNSHQPYEGPVSWYEARLKSDEGWDIVGALFPGSPLVLHGATPNLGWAFTVNKPDLVDIYALEVDDPDHPTRYRFDGKWRTFETYDASFRVKLFGPFSLPINRRALWSVHGPVLVAPHGVYAIRYATLGEMGSLGQYYDMSKAQSFEEWMDAVRTLRIPSLNIVYGDKNGHIAMLYNARMPKRAPGWRWKDYLPGDTSETLWSTYHGLEDMPNTIDPPSGWLFSANATPYQVTDPGQSPNAFDYPSYFGVETNMTNRALRALDLYQTDGSISREEFISYRSDKYYAEDSAPRRVLAELATRDLSKTPELLKAQALIASWDGTATIDNRAAALSILTARRILGFLVNGEDYLTGEELPPVEALRYTVKELKDVYGRIDPKWGEVNRLQRGDKSWPLGGGPDTLRAVYGQGDLAEKGFIPAVGGDTYILMADWSPSGAVDIKTIHQYGAATIDASSPHYDDQSPLFAEEAFKDIPLQLDELLDVASEDVQIGGEPEP